MSYTERELRYAGAIKVVKNSYVSLIRKEIESQGYAIKTEGSELANFLNGHVGEPIIRKGVELVIFENGSGRIGVSKTGKFIEVDQMMLTGASIFNRRLIWIKILPEKLQVAGEVIEKKFSDLCDGLKLLKKIFGCKTELMILHPEYDKGLKAEGEFTKVIQKLRAEGYCVSSDSMRVNYSDLVKMGERVKKELEEWHGNNLVTKIKNNPEKDSVETKLKSIEVFEGLPGGLNMKRNVGEINTKDSGAPSKEGLQPMGGKVVGDKMIVLYRSKSANNITLDIFEVESSIDTGGEMMHSGGKFIARIDTYLQVGDLPVVFEVGDCDYAGMEKNIIGNRKNPAKWIIDNKLKPIELWKGQKPHYVISHPEDVDLKGTKLEKLLLDIRKKGYVTKSQSIEGITTKMIAEKKASYAKAQPNKSSGGLLSNLFGGQKK